MFFDFLTCFAGLYALPFWVTGWNNRSWLTPFLADQILPVGIKGLFFLSLLATIMSTLDSYLFISGQTLGRDYLLKYFPSVNPNFLTRISILISAILGIILIIIYPSVIDLWYVIGSIFIPGLLIPVLGIYLEPFQLPGPLPFIPSYCVRWSLFSGWFSERSFPTSTADMHFTELNPSIPGCLLRLVCGCMDAYNPQFMTF
jgi:solute:Na+ symporter, SSS family